MKYIDTLREGERISEVYLVKSRQNALTKAGKPYGNVVLQEDGNLRCKDMEPFRSGGRGI